MKTHRSAGRFKCERCRQEVIVITPGEGQLVCCGEAMNTPAEGLVVDKKFVEEWSNLYAETRRRDQGESHNKKDMDWMFKEMGPARRTLQKAGFWTREVGDASGEAWLEYVKVMRELSINLDVPLRELSKALLAYENFGDSYRPCPYCRGTGIGSESAPGAIMTTCPACEGKRFNFIHEDSQLCTKCCGTGEFVYASGIATIRKPCPDCHGTGWVCPANINES
jgi:desulfoferrodoxin-like iron-binding protein